MGGSRRAVRDTQVIDSIGRVMRWVGRGLRHLIDKASTELVKYLAMGGSRLAVRDIQATD